MRLPSLPPYLSTLPGAEQRLRALRVLAVSGLVLLLRPFWPLSWLPGWVAAALDDWRTGALDLVAPPLALNGLRPLPGPGQPW